MVMPNLSPSDSSAEQGKGQSEVLGVTSPTNPKATAVTTNTNPTTLLGWFKSTLTSTLPGSSPSGPERFRGGTGNFSEGDEDSDHGQQRAPGAFPRSRHEQPRHLGKGGVSAGFSRFGSNDQAMGDRRRATRASRCLNSSTFTRPSKSKTDVFGVEHQWVDEEGDLDAKDEDGVEEEEEGEEEEVDEIYTPFDGGFPDAATEGQQRGGVGGEGGGVGGDSFPFPINGTLPSLLSLSPSSSSSALNERHHLQMPLPPFAMGSFVPSTPPATISALPPCQEPLSESPIRYKSPPTEVIRPMPIRKTTAPQDGRSENQGFRQSIQIQMQAASMTNNASESTVRQGQGE
ncbi:hypothetical protein IE53DRAFT_207413 [Violaceomyces palustris]|uniref:Uncharacterized protein n=1 Tax=Violaceomyces palustris TaxID=1673888 RepID=A0ACD0NQZ1_9BASI|nr:hypothetical protein IE53DRAFT_207413 [Violaceomyces palustris]